MSPRVAPPDRFENLVRTAAEVFARDGYARAQMGDVAKALGVAKGTVYLYVESKAALFDCVARALAAGEVEAPDELPVPTPQPGATVAFVAAHAERSGRLDLLERALEPGAPAPADPCAELRDVLLELYDLLDRHSQVIRLIEKCAVDYPELAAAWYRAGRITLLGRVAAYLEVRRDQGAIARWLDLPVTARFVLETVTMWTVHRKGDLAPQDIDEDRARSELVELVAAGLEHGRPLTTPRSEGS